MTYQPHQSEDTSLKTPTAEQLLDGAQFVQHRGGGQFRTCAEWDASGVFIPLSKWFALQRHLSSADGVAMREVPVTLEQVEAIAKTMWKGEPVPGRVLRFGAAVLGLADAAAWNRRAPDGVSEVPPIPEGYVLVPVKPTPAMVEVMLDWGTKRSEWEMILRAANPPTDGVKAIGLPERRQLPEREGSTYFRALGWNECLDEIAQRNAGVTTALPLNDERIEEIIASMMDNAGRVPMLKVHKALLAEAIAGVQAVCSRGCPATEACKAIRSGGECTRGVPAVPDCETCHGEGTIDERLGGYSFSNPAATCPDCDGTGEGPAGVAAAPADLSKHRGEAPTADGMFPGESVAEAARSWQGWCEHRSMTGLALFLGKVATLADGVTVLGHETKSPSDADGWK